MSDLRYWVWLSNALGAGSRSADELLKLGYGAEQLYRIERGELDQILFLTDVEKERLRRKNMADVNRLLLDCEKRGVSILSYGDEGYPANLRHIFSPPLVLYYRGTLPDFETAPLFTIVGTRKASENGLRAAYEFAAQLSKLGFIIVSGMAFGNDTAANKGALSGGSPTLAILGCGVDIVYPSNNRELMQKIIENGAVISEFPLGMAPLRQNFPTRNRIMAGLPLGILVVEAPEKSGALITAKLGLNEGKDVFALPGDIYSFQSKGTNKLIQDDGAKMTMSVDDILAEYEGLLTIDKPAEMETDTGGLARYEGLSPVEMDVIKQLLHHKKLFVDEISEKTGLHPQQLTTALMMLEMKGMVKETGGNNYRIME